MRAIHEAAGRRVEVSVVKVAPLHLKLEAETYPQLVESLEIGLRALGADSIVTG